MQTFYTLSTEQQHTAVALGFFDGLHRGHRRVLAGAARQQKNGLLPVCFTFSESPKSVIRGKALPALMTQEDKLHALAQIGMAHVYLTDFRAVMHLDARDFFTEILVGRLKVRALFCGFNYRFGKNAEGDVRLLQTLCVEHGVLLTVVPPETDGGEVVCSTLIRQLLEKGDIRRANALLGSRFGMCATVRHGRRLGRQLGTPTLNQTPAKGLAVPPYGVYASVVTLENGMPYCGVTNIGVKPTVGGTELLWETWMPHYTGGEIYGETADVRLLDFIRPERKFDSLEALKAEILRNGEQAERIYLSRHT